MTRQRVLAVAPWVPSAVRPRSLGLLTALADEFEVRLISATWSESDVEDLGRLPISVRGVAFRRAAAAARAASCIFSRRPLQQGYLDSRQFRRVLREEIERFQPDVVYFNTLRSAQWRRCVPSGIRLAIDLDEFRSKYYDQLSVQSRNPIKRLVAKVEARRMRREEQRILRDFDAVMICAETDVSGDRNLYLVRNPHALDLREPQPSKEAVPTIVFVGRMSYGANVEGVQWFAREVFPQLAESVPGVQLRIVGEGPPKSVQALAGQNIFVSGRVESVLAEYRRAWASIVPVTAATGVQMKLIESLTAGTPSVVTSIVARQARVAHGEQVLVADSAAEWIDAVRDLMTNTSLRERISAAGEVWASTSYSVESISDSVRTVVRGVMPPA